MALSYFLLKANLLSLRVGPSSPVGRLISRGKIVHFWTLEALEIATLLALSIPACMPFKTAASGPLKISVTLFALLPTERHHSIVSGRRSSVGMSLLLLSTTTLNVMKHERNFLLSPIKITFERQGSISLIVSSTGIGATFSPPAVMISSLIRPKKSDKIFYK